MSPGRRPSPHPGDHETQARLLGLEPLPDHVLSEIRRTRRFPRPSQPDYLHLVHLLADIRKLLRSLPEQPQEVLDIFCGTRPYDDLFPRKARLVGHDVNVRYGVPDVVSSEFLPFPDASFDLVTCFEGFHYVEDPVAGVGEIERVLRPRGHALITVPFVWEYDPGIMEHRFTSSELAALFKDWDEVGVILNGGRAVSWAALSGNMLDLCEQHLARTHGHWRLFRAAFMPLYFMLNVIAVQIDRLETRLLNTPLRLPMNLAVLARRGG